jgi:hypothetical protein
VRKNQIGTASIASVLPESPAILRERARTSAEELQRVTVAIPVAALGVFFVALTQKVEPALTPTERFFLIVAITGMGVAAFCSIFTWMADAKWNEALAAVKENVDATKQLALEKAVMRWINAETAAFVIFTLSFCPAMIATAVYVWLRAK